MALDVVAVITAKEGSEIVVREALVALVAATTREEPGCLSYVLSESATSPGTFVTVEQWTDQAALDAHLQTPHITEALTLVADALAAPPAIHPLVPVS